MRATPNLNRVFLMGNLTADPELRYTQTGTAVADIRIAVNRTYKTQSGEKREDTCFVDVVLWARQAELVKQNLTKGRPIFIEGRLKLDSWESKDGEKRSRLRVVAEDFQFIGGREEQAADRYAPRPPEGGAPTGAAEQELEDDLDLVDEDMPF
jgi:single-strand DNA-binding protein